MASTKFNLVSYIGWMFQIDKQKVGPIETLLYKGSNTLADFTVH